MFFKTVKSDGKSVWARGPLCRTYVVGKRYRFRKEFPAHVFSGTFKTDGSLNVEETYLGRMEASRGNRVLICYGEVVEKTVPCIDVSSACWDLLGFIYETANRETCADFVVIGELPLPSWCLGVRPREEPNPWQTKIIMPGQFQKKS